MFCFKKFYKRDMILLEQRIQGEEVIQLYRLLFFFFSLLFSKIKFKIFINYIVDVRSIYNFIFYVIVYSQKKISVY